MKEMKAVIFSIFCILAVLALAGGAAGNASFEGLSRTSAAGCVIPPSDLGGYHVVHAIWQRPGWGISGHIPRDSKIWI